MSSGKKLKIEFKMVQQHIIHISPEFSLLEGESHFKRIRSEKISNVLIDCSAVSIWPSSACAFLADFIKRLNHRNIKWSLNSIPEDTLKTINFMLYRKPAATHLIKKDEIPVVDDTLSWVVTSWHNIVSTVKLLEDITFWTLLGPFFKHGFRYSRTLFEISERGMRSLGIVALVAGIMGLILAIQAAAQLQNFGATIYIANLVGMAIVRELGPLLAALLTAGRSGSAITAELGSMVASEEMDALRAMGVSVTKYIVVPKFVALFVALPCLTIFADVIGITGGYLFSTIQLGIPSSHYIDQTIQAISANDVMIGLIKSIADAIIIASIAVHQGLNTSGGAEGIGRSTTKSVVHSIIFIAIAHLFFTILFYFTGHTLKFNV
ncbi:MAG: hypothetical protein DRI44_08150 [Chlamydiae bacterium]|nr:MAG: hypothetical protein DRI44_08150 [Chlamydiota bacterium]